MIPALRPDAAVRTPWRSSGRPSETAPTRCAPAPASRAADGQLRCLWYDAAVADTLAALDVFLRSPAGTAALAEFCRAQAGVFEADPLIATVARTAARMRD